MTKRTVIWTILACALCVAVIGICWTFFGVHEITMSQQDLQGKIDAKMPATAKGVTVSNVKLDLTDNKIGLSLDAATRQFEKDFSVKGQTRGQMRYDSNAGSFYFHPEQLKLTQLEVNGADIPEAVSEKVGGLVDKLKKSEKVDGWLKKLRSKENDGTLTGELTGQAAQLAQQAKEKIVDNKDAIMENAQKAVETVAQSSAEFVLQRIPVYTLPNDLKGNCVRIVLKDVEVRDGNVVAHLSLWQLTTWVIGWLITIIAIIALAVVIVVCPESLSFLG